MLNTKRNEIFNNNEIVNVNDLRKRIVNIDSTFRTNMLETTTNFTVKFDHPYKNVIKLRVASVEIPNMEYVFSYNNHKNTFFTIQAFDYTNTLRTVYIQIPDGNYGSSDLMIQIKNMFIKKLFIPYGIYIDITQDPIQIKTILVHYGSIKIPVGGSGSLPWPPTQYNWTYLTTTAGYDYKPPQPFNLNFMVKEYKQRDYDSGLGFNLGFRQKYYTISEPYEDLSGQYNVNPLGIVPESCIDVIGDMYYFLCIDDFHTVEQASRDNYFQCLAKIIIRESKGQVIYDDGSTLLSNDVVFPAPIDLKQVHIRLINSYGETIDLNDMTLSISLEITEVLNTKLYEFYRNYIWLGQIPQLAQNVEGSGLPLLGGRGP